MKRVFIVVEGQTEEEFVRTILYPYFLAREIYDVTPILIHTSKTGRGGFVNYIHLKNTILALLKTQGADVLVTTFVDFFRMPNNTPQYEQCMLAASNKERVVRLEQCVGEDIADRRFVPYIQLHEFEALLFSNNKGFEAYFTVEQAKQTGAIVEAYKNPEEINTHPQYAPSKRILGIKENYNKPIEGILIALDVGVDTMLKRCPRFAAWMDDIVQRCT